MKQKSVSEVVAKIQDLEKKSNDKQDQQYLITVSKELEQAQALGQEVLANRLKLTIECMKKELIEVKSAGYDQYVSLADIDQFIDEVNDISTKHVKYVELEYFPRIIPAEAAKKIKSAQEVFDVILVLFTDYEESLDEESFGIRDQDVIAFGVLTACKKNQEVPNFYYYRAYPIVNWQSQDEYGVLAENSMIDEFIRTLD